MPTLPPGLVSTTTTYRPSLESTGQAHTAHTTGPVPLVYFGRPATLAPGGALRDIAPTLLALIGLPQPAQMTGRSLVQLH